MIIDCETWKEMPLSCSERQIEQTKGLPVFVSWKRLKEMMIGDQQAYTIETSDLGLLIRVNMFSYDERGKHPMADRQV